MTLWIRLLCSVVKFRSQSFRAGCGSCRTSRGAETRLADAARVPVELALREIAGNRFKPDEVRPFVLAGSVARDGRVRPGQRRKFRGGQGNPRPSHPPSIRGRFTDCHARRMNNGEMAEN